MLPARDDASRVPTDLLIGTLIDRAVFRLTEKLPRRSQVRASLFIDYSILNIFVEKPQADPPVFSKIFERNIAKKKRVSPPPSVFYRHTSLGTNNVVIYVPCTGLSRESRLP